MSASQVLDACEEMAGESILECHCPYCQGYFEVRPAADLVEIGYQRNDRFDVVILLPAEGMTVLRDTTTGSLRVRLSGRDWKFEE